MCDPMTAAVVGAQAFGQLYQGASQRGESRYQAAVSRNNAALSVEQARDARTRGEEESRLKWREIAATKGAQIAAMAAQGIDTSFGSAADVIGDTAVLGMEDINQIGQNQEREVRGFLIQAQNYREQGKAQKRAGDQAMIAGVINAGSTVLGGAKSMPNISLPGFGAKGGSGGSAAPTFTPGPKVSAGAGPW